jgi:hypothetical protein
MRGGTRANAGRKSKTVAPAPTGPQQGEAVRADVLTRFQPGQSGNPRGRTKGSRNKLSENFLADMVDAWEQYGREALHKTATEHPEKFVSVVAGVLPKQIEVKDELSDLTDEQLAALHSALNVLAGCASGASTEAGKGNSAQTIN